MEGDVIDVGGEIPLDRAQILGEGLDALDSVGGQRGGGHAGERRTNSASGRLPAWARAVGVPSSRSAASQLLSAVRFQSGHQPVDRLIRPIEAEQPDLGMEEVAGPGASDLVHHGLEKGHQIRRLSEAR